MHTWTQTTPGGIAKRVENGLYKCSNHRRLLAFNDIRHTRKNFYARLRISWGRLSIDHWDICKTVCRRHKHGGDINDSIDQWTLLRENAPHTYRLTPPAKIYYGSESFHMLGKHVAASWQTRRNDTMLTLQRRYTGTHIPQPKRWSRY